MSDCSSHKKDILGVTDMNKLAEMIGDLHYETFAELLNKSAIKLMKDHEKDLAAGREELARCLLWTYYGIHKASYGAERAWKVSKPFMNK